MDTTTRKPSLSYLFAFWIISNVLVVLWVFGEISDVHLPGSLGRAEGVAFYILTALVPFLLLFWLRRLIDFTTLGLLVCCCLALSAASHEANLLRESMQISLDHERSFLHTEFVEGIIRPLISIIVDAYVRILGDDHHHGQTSFTHIAINYMFDSASFIAVFALGTRLLTAISTWLCLFIVAFIAQTAPMMGRMGNVFLSGGFFWQLFLLSSKRYIAAITCGIVICFMRTDVVFATTFAIPSTALFERRWPTQAEWWTFFSLIGISLLIPEVLIALHPNANFASFLITHGDYFGKIIGNLVTLKLAVALACPMLAVIIVSKWQLSRTVAVVIPPALIYLGIVFLIADFTETRLLGPTLGAFAFVCSERLGALLQASERFDVGR
ncbi:MAG: hypothetical protein KGL35_17955 [Bradyrhizobium sp.]|uniref:hypothetical protein n=1 Tax=Bradyrhizobium sp. TaxID=376 RepID=UPI001C282DBF|nr:hypothetical protein [Bradyrhizobium sp.]MBU6463649.1 hypothetical protein [Pseudomonadota bacterium]MDE2066376.1 hypothetical protein [Bradyrhizobium sp.]MDE2470572.1 hypothetical protein [Bradyrhizobium sp.]